MHLTNVQWLTISTLYVLCYWPTYFIPSIEPVTMQKSYFFVMVGYLILVTLASRAKIQVPYAAYIFCFPLLAMLVSFPFNITDFRAFHLTVMVKPILLFLYVTLFYSLLASHFNTRDCIKLKGALTKIFIVQLIIISLQIVFGDVALLKILSFKEVYDGVTFRAPGTFDWVYITCYFFSFFLAFYIIELFLGTKRKTAAILLILALIAILLSQSKTGYLATIIIAFYFTFLSMILKLGIANKILFSMVILLASFVGVIIYFDINLDYVAKFIELMQQGKLDGSTSTRKNQTLIAISEGLTYWYKGSPMALKGYIIENSYLDYLFRYGLSGFTAFLSMILILYYYSLTVCLTCKKLYDKEIIDFHLLQLSIACHVSFFAASLYSFTGTPIDAYRSALWSTFVIALVCFINNLNKQAIKTSYTAFKV